MGEKMKRSFIVSHTVLINLEGMNESIFSYVHWTCLPRRAFKLYYLQPAFENECITLTPIINQSFKYSNFFNESFAKTISSVLERSCFQICVFCLTISSKDLAALCSNWLETHVCLCNGKKNDLGKEAVESWLRKHHLDVKSKKHRMLAL